MELKEKVKKIKLANIPFKLNAKEFYNFVKRVTNKDYANKIEVRQVKSSDGYDFYNMYDNNDKIIIEATSGSAAGVAFNTYLKERCNYYIGFLNTNGTLPIIPPKVNNNITNHSIFHYRYFLNYCTFGYSFAYYDWKDYEKVIDRMILSGYNLVLNPIGQESIWREVLLQLGYSEKQALDFLVDIAFMPWFNMMNITTYLANYDDKEYARRLNIANKFSKRLQAFGISPMLPGYCGMVPNDFTKHFPDSKIIDQGLWCGYERQDYLVYTDPMFKKVADLFYQTQNRLLGKNKCHYYSTDPFHEGGITDGIDLQAYSKNLFAIMKENDRKAIWSLQGWEGNPKHDIISVIEPERILICNLLSDNNIKGDFDHRPWIYCSINDFGGNHILRCGLNKQLTRPFQLVSNNDYTCVGIGLMPEAIETDEIIFDVQAYSAINNQSIDVDKFINRHIELRYGYISDSLKKAWLILKDKIYVDDIVSHEFESVFVSCPSNELPKNSFHCKAPFGPYPDSALNVAKLLLENYENCKNSKAYIFDLVDITRQVNADFARHLAMEMEKAYNAKKYNTFKKNADLFIKLMKLQDKLCSCHQRFLLSSMMSYPKAYGKTKQDKWHNVYCTKRILTVWGDERCQCILNDYTNREYGGMIKDYYLPRWELFINKRKESLRNKTPMEDIDWFIYGDTWAKNPKEIKCKLLNNPDKIAREILTIVEENRY